MNGEINVENVFLKTKRMILRPWRQEDLEELFAYASVDGVGQMAGWNPHKTPADSQMILDLFIREKKTFALEYQRKVVGSLGIEKYNEKILPEFESKKGKELGFVLSKDYWGRGLIQEAVDEVCRYFFEDWRGDFLTCSHFEHNIQSRRVQEKCGFRFYKWIEVKTQIGNMEKVALNILTKDTWEKERGV